MLRVPAVQNNKAVKRYVDYKLAVLAAARADEGPDALQKAVTALDRFRKDHPDSWELVPVTRALARLYQDRQPPDFEAARKAYEELAASGAPADVKAECAFQAIDLLLAAGKSDDAKRRLAALPAADPRTKVYEIGCQATPGRLPAAAKQLEDLIDK